MKQHRGPKKKTISISNFTGMNRQQSSNNSIQEISGLAYQLQIIIIIIIIIRREHKRKMGKRGVGVIVRNLTRSPMVRIMFGFSSQCCYYASIYLPLVCPFSLSSFSEPVATFSSVFLLMVCPKMCYRIRLV